MTEFISSVVSRVRHSRDLEIAEATRIVGRLNRLVVDYMGLGALHLNRDDFQRSLDIKRSLKLSFWLVAWFALISETDPGGPDIFCIPEFKEAVEHNFFEALTGINSSTDEHMCMYLVRKYRATAFGSGEIRESMELLYWASPPPFRHFSIYDIQLRPLRILTLINVYFYGCLGVLVQILVPRLVMNSSLRKFPRDLIRGVAMCLVAI